MKLWLWANSEIRVLLASRRFDAREMYVFYSSVLTVLVGRQTSTILLKPSPQVECLLSVSGASASCQ